MKKIAVIIFSAVLVAGLSGCGVQPKEENEEYVTSTVEVVKPQVQNACGEACDNYVNKCLTLVPNADSELFQEGKDTCVEDCATWDDEKTQCMVSAKACTEMTDVCGL
jgi:hypothetical protein